MDKLAVNIEMSDETVKVLVSSGYQLMAFRSVESSDSGMPVVWFRTRNYANNTRVE